MSVALRIRGDQFECDWGVLNNSEASPSYTLEPLMLAAQGYVQKLIDEGPLPGPRGGIHSITTDGQRTFAHLDFNGNRTTWELFDAHFEDGVEPHDKILIGRWPD